MSGEKLFRTLASWLLVAPSVTLLFPLIVFGGLMSVVLAVTGVAPALLLAGVCLLGGKALHHFLTAWGAYYSDGIPALHSERANIQKAIFYAIIPVLVGLFLSVDGLSGFAEPIGLLFAFYLSGLGLVFPLASMALQKPEM